jgi:hypothetical protein
MLKVLGIAAVLLILSAVGLAVWVRFSPNDPARWHVDVAGSGDPTPGACAQAVNAMRGAARVSCLVPGGPAETLARLDAIALASPRTIRLAGSADSGRITWQTRTALWGFPDHTTAQATATEAGTRLDIFARLRFGGDDVGVNAARLKAWLAALQGSPAG